MAFFPSSLTDWEKTSRRVAILVLLYAIPAFQAMLPIDDPDLWWHLRTGQWILEHGRVPMEDPFSVYGMGKPWIAYSWLFEILVYGLFRKLGLSGILLFLVVTSLLIALAIQLSIRRAKLPFLAEVVLLAVAFSSMKPIYTPRSWLFSILFFTIELYILFHMRRTGKLAAGFLLPPLFALWANLHLQFIYGLAVLGLLIGEAIMYRRLFRQSLERESALPVERLSFIALACVLATFITPYHYHLYRPLFEISLQTGAFQNISELHPLFFRSPADWFVLALTIGAAYVLGSQRYLLSFPFLLLLMGAFLAFRARRDVWVVVLAATFIISEYQRVINSGGSFALTRVRIACVVVGVMLAVYLIGWHRQLSEPKLQAFVERDFPVGAVHFINQNKFAGPLYNNLDWGGYLIWSLPNLPVSMDGRMNVHGDQRIERSLATWAGYKGWDSDPELMNSRLVIAGVERPLTSLLRIDPRFKLVFEDGTAAVFVPANRGRKGN